MNCQNCQTENESDANFCKNCGSAFELSLYVDSNQHENKDSILVMVIAFMFITRIFWAIVPIIIGNWMEVMKIPNLVLSVVWGFAPIALTMAMKDNNLKQPLMILGVIYAIYSIYDAVFRFMAF